MKKTSIPHFLLLLILFHAHADVASALPKELLKAITDNGFDFKGLGLYIQEVNAEKPLVSLNEKEFLNPASVIKLVTTSAALELLGSGYRWTTEFYYSGTIKSGILNGNLYIHGNGDPYLTPERLWLMLNRIAIFGIKNINGDVVFDDRYFSPDPVDYAAFDEQPHRTYNVGPNAILLGFQATEFHFALDDQNAEPSVKIVPFPDSPRMRIINNVRLTNGSCGRWQKRLFLSTESVADVLHVKFSGRYARNCDKRTLYRRVTTTRDHFQHFFLPLWQQLGGTVNGVVKQGEMPKNLVSVIQENSITVAEAVRLINKFSNNVMTQQILLSLGAYLGSPPGTKQKGIAAIKHWLVKNALYDNALHLDNGAGLSRDTRISAELLGRLLHRNFKQSYMPEFIASLPVSGYDGTMAHRFKNEPLIGRAHIKTGLLDFVQSMAGYVTTQSGKRFVVVLLHNHARAHTKAGERLQDSVLRWVFEQ